MCLVARLARRLLVGMTLLTCSIHALSQTSLDGQDEAFLEATCPNGPEPEELLNCDLMQLVRSGLDVVVQNHASADLEVSARLRAASKILVRAVVLEGAGPLAQAWTAGLLRGVEVDWVSPETEPFTEHMPTVESVLAHDASGPAYEFARVYGLDAAQLAGRRAFLEAMNGTLRRFPVFEGDTLVAENGVANLAADATEVRGRVVAAGDLWCGGVGSMYAGGVLAGADCQIAPGSVVSWVRRVPALPGTSPLLDVAAARALAQQVGTYYAGSVTFDASLPPPGLIFAEGDVTVASPGATGRSTFISATGHVTFAGSGATLEASLGHLLGVAYLGDIRVSGADSRLFGELHAPSGNGLWLSNQSLLHGVLRARTIGIMGFAPTLSDGTHAWAGL